MQLIQLITFAALTLSHAQAIVIPPHQLEIIEQIVTLTTRPDILIKSTPELKPFEGMASRSPLLYDHQLHQGAMESLTSLRSWGDDKTAHIFQSITAYHATTSPARLQIYRDSIYSRMVDLAHDNPEEVQAHLNVAHAHLTSSLEDTILRLKEQRLKPLGNQKVIQQLQEFVARFNEKNKDKIEEYTKNVVSKLPLNKDFGPMKYLSMDEVNKALEATNSPNLPPAILIDGFKHLSQTHAPTHPASPIAAAPVVHAAAA